jgi:hypothetical protein
MVLKMKILKKYKNPILFCSVFFVVMMSTGVGCIFRFLTGIPCPACGMTRAYLSLLNLDIKSAFYYHPLFFLIPIVIYLIVSADEADKRAKSRKSLIMLVIIIIFLLTWIYRLFFMENSPVTIDISSCIVVKLVSKIIKGVSSL